MKKLAFGAALALGLLVVPAFAQTCNVSNTNVSYFQTVVRLYCGLNPTVEESRAFICSIPNGQFKWMVPLAINYCVLNGG